LGGINSLSGVSQKRSFGKPLWGAKLKNFQESFDEINLFAYISAILTLTKFKKLSPGLK